MRRMLSTCSCRMHPPRFWSSGCQRTDGAERAVVIIVRRLPRIPSIRPRSGLGNDVAILDRPIASQGGRVKHRSSLRSVQFLGVNGSWNLFCLTPKYRVVAPRAPLRGLDPGRDRARGSQRVLALRAQGRHAPCDPSGDRAGWSPVITGRGCAGSTRVDFAGCLIDGRYSRR